MNTDFGILLPLWTYTADQGELLERAVGEVGLDHVAVPVLTGRETHFRIGADNAAPLFHTPGGWHFQATAKAYSAAGVRPAKARWLGAADPLGRLREHLARSGIRLVPRIDMRALDGLVQREQHMCRRNAWGQEALPAGACVNNPDCREVLRATTEDLKRYEPTGFELAGWLPDSPKGTLPAYLENHELLDTCFCPACRQIAEREGVDAERAARAVREQLMEKSPLDDTELLCAYTTARRSDWARWLRGLDEANAHVTYLLMHDPAQEGESREGTPLPLLERLSEALDDGRKMPDSFAGARGVALRPWQPLFREAADLVRLVSQAARDGAGYFDFETLDEAPPEAVTWTKQAVRYARRG